MEKLLIFGVADSDFKKIRQIAGRMRLGLELVSPACYGNTLGSLFDGGAHAEADAAKIPAISESLLVMCNLSGKRIDKLLFELRRENVTVDYKAVLTPTNRSWTIPQVFFEMQKEKAALRRP